MNAPRTLVAITTLGAWLALGLGHLAEAQVSWDEGADARSEARTQWQPRGTLARALTRNEYPQRDAAVPRETNSPVTGGLTDYRMAQRPAYQRPPVRGLAMQSEEFGARSAATLDERSAMPAEPPIGRAIDMPWAADEAYGAGPSGSRGTGCAACGEYGGDYGGGDCAGGECGVPPCGGCGFCDQCLDAYDPCLRGCGRALVYVVGSWFLRELQVFGGPHSFRGPLDLGASNNFGFHEGVNLGGPVGAWDIGYQVGFAAATSNLSADQLQVANRGNRTQYFFTAGLFKRALCGGLQWGLALDLLHDEYFDKANLKQLRSETSWVFWGGRHEIGYFGAYQIGTDTVSGTFNVNQLVNRRLSAIVEPTDMYAAFYRCHFETGAEGRVWGGATGRGQAMIGADVRVPLGGALALESSLNYLVPNGSRNVAQNGRFEESWGLNVNLVWYPGRRAACVDKSCFRPLFNVADNASFMVRTDDPNWAN